MSYMNPEVEVDGQTAELSELSENYAVINRVGGTFLQGAPCRITVSADLMGKRVFVKLKGEIVQLHDDIIEVMFAAPTRNWDRIIRAIS